MTTTKEILSEWFDEGVRRGATHMIVAVDGFDHEDYPDYVMPGQDVREIVKNSYSGQNMQRCMEVYNLAKNKAAQLAVRRCYEY